MDIDINSSILMRPHEGTVTKVKRLGQQSVSSSATQSRFQSRALECGGGRGWSCRFLTAPHNHRYECS